MVNRLKCLNSESTVKGFDKIRLVVVVDFTQKHIRKNLYELKTNVMSAPHIFIIN